MKLFLRYSVFSVLLMYFTGNTKAVDLLCFTNNFNSVQATEPVSDTLYILWSGSDKEVAINMIFMYANASLSEKWWDVIVIYIWGPSVMLAANDKEVIAYLNELKQKGAKIIACMSCCDKYNITEKLILNNFEVRYVGKEFTSLIKNQKNLLLF